LADATGMLFVYGNTGHICALGPYGLCRTWCRCRRRPPGATGTVAPSALVPAEPAPRAPAQSALRDPATTGPVTSADASALGAGKGERLRRRTEGAKGRPAAVWRQGSPGLLAWRRRYPHDINPLPSQPRPPAGSPAQLTQGLAAGNGNGGADVDPFYSPDGTPVYFASDRPANGDYAERVQHCGRLRRPDGDRDLADERYC
jgi:hypothetical protein